MKISKNYKWEVLLLLWIAYFLNQADRQIFNVVLPLIKMPSAQGGLGLTDIEVGTIATVFNLIYAFLVPIAGWFGDLFSRKWIVTVSVLFWSVATMFTGFSTGILSLILFRSLATGGGEAFFGPANYSLLASYHKETRSFAMSLHQTAYYIGIILTGFVAGYVGEHYGWRSAFYIFGSIGVIHGVVMLVRLRDRKPIASEQPEALVAKEKVNLWECFKLVFRTPTAACLTIGFAGLIFVLTGYLTWMPTYLYENFGMSLSQAGLHSMLYTHFFAFVGIILAGKLSDKLAKRNPANRMLLQGLGLLAAAPCLLLMGNSNVLLVIYFALAGFGFARAFFDANTYTVLYDVIPEKYHSTASGIMIMTGFGVGSLSPLILGLIKSVWGLSMGISSLAILWVVCGLLLIYAYRRFYPVDYAKNHECLI